MLGFWYNEGSTKTGKGTSGVLKNQSRLYNKAIPPKKLISYAEEISSRSYSSELLHPGV